MLCNPKPTNTLAVIVGSDGSDIYIYNKHGDILKEYTVLQNFLILSHIS